MEKPSASQTSQAWTILKLLRWTTSYFQDNRVESPRASAEILLANVLSYRRIDLYIRHEQPLTKEELARFKSLIQRRIKREPTAYIIGSKEFWSKDLTLTPDVLIPRPETECLVEAGLEFLRSMRPENPRRILELGTGSGAISIALASERPVDIIAASDISYAALKIARQNAFQHHLNDRIQFFAADWFAALHPNTPGFDLIISNPPYIPSEAVSGLQPEVRLYEPRTALDGGPDGLSSIKHIILKSPGFLLDHGCLLLEIGHDQKEAIQEFVYNNRSFQEIKFIKDYSGLDRIAKMTCPSKIANHSFEKG